jgi:AcrR family transcriptional regulator
VARPLHYLDDPETLQREREAFLQAALELIAETGTVDVQVAQVVRRAGRHNASFYRVFGSKEGLALAVMAEAARRTALALERRVRRADSATEAVRGWALLILGLAAAPQTTGVQAVALDRYKLLQRFPDAEASIAHPLQAPLSRVLQEEGLPHPDVLAEAALELVLSRQASWIALGHKPSDAELRAYADLTVRLVGLTSPRQEALTDLS